MRAARRTFAGAVFGFLACAATSGAAQRAAADEPVVPALPADFAYGLAIVTPGDGESPAWRVALPIEVYRALVRADRGDLRVFNARGEVVPYQLRGPAQPEAILAPLQTLPLFALRGDPVQALRAMRVRIESDGAAVSVQAPAAAAAAPGAAPVATYIVDGRPLKVPVAAFELRWADSAAQFAGRLEIEASDDLDVWRSVGSGSIANLTAGAARLVENRIDLPATAARYWRLTWSGAAAPFAIESVGARPASRRPESVRASLRVTARPVASRPGEYELDLGAALPIDRVDVILPDANTVAQVVLSARNAPDEPWSPAASVLPLFRLTTAGRETRNGMREIPAVPRRYWRLQSLPPGTPLGTAPPTLELAWPPHEVWFIARGPAPFLLAYGSARVGVAETGLETILAATRRNDGTSSVIVAPATLGAARTLGGEAQRVAPPPSFPWRVAILWAVLVAGVGVLGAMALRLMRETRPRPG